MKPPTDSPDAEKYTHTGIWVLWRRTVDVEASSVGRTDACVHALMDMYTLGLHVNAIGWTYMYVHQHWCDGKHTCYTSRQRTHLPRICMSQVDDSSNSLQRDCHAVLQVTIKLLLVSAVAPLLQTLAALRGTFVDFPLPHFLILCAVDLPVMMCIPGGSAFSLRPATSWISWTSRSWYDMLLTEQLWMTFAHNCHFSTDGGCQVIYLLYGTRSLW